jgi:hypothetical protein
MGVPTQPRGSAKPVLSTEIHGTCPIDLTPIPRSLRVLHSLHPGSPGYFLFRLRSVLGDLGSPPWALIISPTTTPVIPAGCRNPAPGTVALGHSGGSRCMRPFRRRGADGRLALPGTGFRHPAWTTACGNSDPSVRAWLPGRNYDYGLALSHRTDRCCGHPPIHGTGFRRPAGMTAVVAPGLHWRRVAVLSLRSGGEARPAPPPSVPGVRPADPAGRRFRPADPAGRRFRRLYLPGR